MEELQTTELDRIKTLLNAAFHGGSWHGPSVLENVKDIRPKTAGARQKGIHTIAELVYHMTTWRIFALKKIQGDADFDIKTEKQNWGNLKEIDDFEWETLQMELTLSHDELISSLAEKDDSFLNEIVPGSEYDFYTLLHGIISHDLYHNGQIGILKKMAPKSSKFNDDEDLSSSRYFNDGFDDEY
ncbi:DinB family protein [Emticicia sp. 17c]|uniref:DinB family protein n=1 Tax=Emticicia sp. 17c TaxID=3127704 RepID=UPI00301D8C56